MIILFCSFIFCFGNLYCSLHNYVFLIIYHFLWNGTTGVYPVKPQMPAVGGFEGVGEVHSIGSAVKGLSPGDLVIPCPPSFGNHSLLIFIIH